jgi:hypothetical protein
MTRITRIKTNRQPAVVVLPAVRSELAPVIGGVKAGSGEPVLVSLTNWIRQHRAG